MSCACRFWSLLADVAASTKVMPKALIAPHAGYVYSGRVAAAAFATLRDSAQTITRVVLIGPAHYFPVRGIAAPTVDAFETPLGRVPWTWRPCVRLPTCHLSFEPTLRMLLSTLSKSSCRSCKLFWHPSRWCRSLSAMRPRRTLPMCCAAVGRAGDADRRQLRFISLSQLRGCTATGFGDRCRHRAWRLGQSRPEPSLRLPPLSWLASGSRAPWPQGPAALIVQFRRHGGFARSGRRIRSLDVRVNSAVGL